MDCTTPAALSALLDGMIEETKDPEFAQWLKRRWQEISRAKGEDRRGMMAFRLGQLLAAKANGADLEGLTPFGERWRAALGHDALHWLNDD